MASFPRRSQIGVRGFAESFSRQFSGRAYINGNRPKTLCNPLAWRQGQRGVTALDGSCFWIMQLKIEKSDSLRDLGQIASDSREGGGARPCPPEYWLVEVMSYHLINYGPRSAVTFWAFS